MTAKIEKRPGADYVVRYQDVASGQIEEMSVCGAATFDAALSDAKGCLWSAVLGDEADDWYEILSIVRVP